MSEKFEIKNINDLLNVFENTDGYYLGDYTCFQIADYIRKMYNQLQQKENIIKEVREYIIQYGNLYCLKHKQFKDYHQYKVILEILDKVEENK